MKKTICILLILLSSVPGLFAQQSDSWHFAWHGFVNPVFFGDTRQVVSGREGMMLFYPQPVTPDIMGDDVNDVPQLNMLSITARLNLSFQGPDVLGAKVKGFIEGDFTGATDATINMLRLRHAYLDMKWQHDELLAGQYWYPMVIEEIMPGTQPLNMGAPFHPYARYNQLRYYHRGLGHNFMKNWELMAVAAFELDNKSQGPEGPSTAYLRHSLIPEMNLQLRYVGEHLFAGAAANYLHIKPIYALPNDGSEQIGFTYSANHISFSLFAKYRWDNWALKCQTLLNSNLYEGCSLGGYILPNYSPYTDCYPGTNAYTFTTLWADFGKTTGHWRPGIFAGYAKQNDVGKIDACMSSGQPYSNYGRGFDIDYMWRIQPRIEYYAGNGLSFACEVEHTVAQFLKDTDPNEYRFHREADPDNKPANTRVILSAVYAF